MLNRLSVQRAISWTRATAFQRAAAEGLWPVQNDWPPARRRSCSPRRARKGREHRATAGAPGVPRPEPRSGRPGHRRDVPRRVEPRKSARGIRTCPSPAGVAQPAVILRKRRAAVGAADAAGNALHSPISPHKPVAQATPSRRLSVAQTPRQPLIVRGQYSSKAAGLRRRFLRASTGRRLHCSAARVPPARRIP